MAINAEPGVGKADIPTRPSPATSMFSRPVRKVQNSACAGAIAGRLAGAAANSDTGAAGAGGAIGRPRARNSRASSELIGHPKAVAQRRYPGGALQVRQAILV